MVSLGSLHQDILWQIKREKVFYPLLIQLIYKEGVILPISLTTPELPGCP